MDKPLMPPVLITPLSKPTKLSAAQTYTHLGSFLSHLPPSPARTQLERLADALGVETGAIAPSEGERREAERKARRAAERAARRAAREEEKRQVELEADGALEDAMERGDADDEDEDNVEMGVGDGDDAMDDKGDVEYGDAEDDDDDEPDNEDLPMDEDAKDD